MTRRVAVLAPAACKIVVIAGVYLNTARRAGSSIKGLTAPVHRPVAAPSRRLAPEEDAMETRPRASATLPAQPAAPIVRRDHRTRGSPPSSSGSLARRPPPRWSRASMATARIRRPQARKRRNPRTTSLLWNRITWSRPSTRSCHLLEERASFEKSGRCCRPRRTTRSSRYSRPVRARNNVMRRSLRPDR